LKKILVVSLFVATIGSGLIGGIFYGFSSFIMAALARIEPQQGVAAMNSINVTVITPSFLMIFVGTAALCLVLGGGSVMLWHHTSAKLIFAASLLYVVGCFGVTMIYNVPLNNQLAAVQPSQITEVWTRYLDVWTMFNHVRTAAAVLASVLFTVALVLI
jgi:uncharacterized membrane protein